jgi:hypothetical protein
MGSPRIGRRNRFRRKSPLFGLPNANWRRVRQSGHFHRESTWSSVERAGQMKQEGAITTPQTMPGSWRCDLRGGLRSGWRERWGGDHCCGGAVAARAGYVRVVLGLGLLAGPSAAPLRFAPAHRHVRTRFGVNGVNSTSFYECFCTAREPNWACMHINVAATSCLSNQSHRCHFAILLSLKV